LKKVQKEVLNKPCKLKPSRRMVMTSIQRREGKESSRREIEVSLMKKVKTQSLVQFLAITRTKRKILIRERFSATTVRNLGTMLMSVGTRKM
jgi:hypothetical protein